MAYKTIDGVIKQISKEFNLGDEASVPYLDGVKGRIVGRKGDLYEVEYTHPKSGITRREQYYRNEYPELLLDALQDEAYPPDPELMVKKENK